MNASAALKTFLPKTTGIDKEPGIHLSVCDMF